MDRAEVGVGGHPCCSPQTGELRAAVLFVTLNFRIVGKKWDMLVGEGICREIPPAGTDRSGERS